MNEASLSKRPLYYHSENKGGKGMRREKEVGKLMV